ncbi:SAM-dependent methyltransferase [Ancylobacter sp. 6x-1]|uniref:SAM-dependent methyltransferase n=1 Tax=Ancylobacter crimeensis TaxID=2579147 RepID=A0ABT0DBN9_9HYPH|nr:N-6 DNA methylase [Ancylobacter crimeensis]MCK0197377.1 SAM-dependent methyltransferase [Ancylobacter crimeensis]
MQTPFHKEFIATLGSIGRDRARYDRFGDFLELAYCAVAKQTADAPRAELLEARYMNVVRRYPADDIRALPKLLALIQLALIEGGCDFLGGIAAELGALDTEAGQFFTPYEVSRLMAEISMGDAPAVIAERGFVTLDEPACGAGCMVIAAADALTATGHDIGQALYVEAADLSATAFKMAYLQLAARGVPALVRHADSLRPECFEAAWTPDMVGFLACHGEAFARWRSEARPAEPALRAGQQLLLL